MFSVMTFNVGNGLADPTRLAGLLRDNLPDVVGLEELAPAQAEGLSSLADLYPYQILVPTGFSGKGLLSRFPIAPEEHLMLFPDRPDIHAVVDLDGTRLYFLVGHPPPARLRGLRMVIDPRAMAQMQTLTDLALQHAPAVLVGDFNITPATTTYKRFTDAGLVDAFAVAGDGRGWTLPRRVGQTPRFQHGLHRVPLTPVARVDYIWCTPEIRVEAAWVGTDAGSDHLPVFARLDL